MPRIYGFFTLLLCGFNRQNLKMAADRMLTYLKHFKNYLNFKLIFFALRVLSARKEP